MTHPLDSVAINTPAGARKIFFRPNTSDRSVIDQTFGHGQHDLRKLPRFGEIMAHVNAMQQAGMRPLIIDAGANIGATSVFMTLTFPTARIIAIEPEAGNFAMLQRNVAGLDVTCVQAALAGHAGHTRISDPGSGDWAFRTDPAATGPEVRAMTMTQVLSEFGEPSFFPLVVKVDIEGAERELFAENTEWVARLPVLIVELHDWLLPKQRTAQPFLRCIAPLDRDFVQIGENVFSIDNQF